MVSDCGTTISGGNVGAFSFHVTVVVGASGAPMLCRLRERWSKLSFPLDAMRKSLGDSSIIAHCGVEALLRVETLKMAPSSPLLGERLG
jgi:hypothetical protein